VTDGSLTETDGSLTDMHGRGHVDPGPERGPLSRCAAKQVCRCACDGGGVSMYRGANASVDFAMVSLQLSYMFARTIL